MKGITEASDSQFLLALSPETHSLNYLAHTSRKINNSSSSFVDKVFSIRLLKACDKNEDRD